MADNTTLNAGSGGDVIRTDETAPGVKTQVNKLGFGPDGELVLVTTEDRFPVSLDAEAADGGAAPAKALVLGGYDGSAVQRLVTDASGVLQVDVLETPTKALLESVKALLETIDADTGNIATSTGTLDNAIAGNEMQVDVVGALPAGNNNIGDVDVASLPALATGTNSIGKIKSLEEALPAGTNAIDKLAANSGVDIGDVDVTSIAAGSNLIGNVALGVRTSGGLTIFRSLDIDETEEDVKTSAGQLYWYHYANRTAEELFLKFYNATAANVTVGTTTPVLTIPLAKESQGHVPIPQGFAFSTAITVACVKGVADNSSTGPAENGCVINLGYA